MAQPCRLRNTSAICIDPLTHACVFHLHLLLFSIIRHTKYNTMPEWNKGDSILNHIKRQSMEQWRWRWICNESICFGNRGCEWNVGANNTNTQCCIQTAMVNGNTRIKRYCYCVGNISIIAETLADNTSYKWSRADNFPSGNQRLHNQ